MWVTPISFSRTRSTAVSLHKNTTASISLSLKRIYITALCVIPVLHYIGVICNFCDRVMCCRLTHFLWRHWARPRWLVSSPVCISAGVASGESWYDACAFLTSLEILILEQASPCFLCSTAFLAVVFAASRGLNWGVSADSKSLCWVESTFRKSHDQWRPPTSCHGGSDTPEKELRSGWHLEGSGPAPYLRKHKQNDSQNKLISRQFITVKHLMNGHHWVCLVFVHNCLVWFSY